MSTCTRFQKAAEEVMKLKSDPTKEEMLKVYGLFKQATIGDCNTDCPSIWDVKGRAKWTEWNMNKGLSREMAQNAYIFLIEKLKKTYGF